MHCQDTVYSADQGLLQGSIAWSSSDSAGAFSHEQCSPQGPNNQVQCQANYTPGPSSAQTVSAVYSGDSAHASSQSAFTIFTAAQSSSKAVAVSLSCQATYPNVGPPPTACTATVYTANGVAPTGAITWSSSSGGSFSQTTCASQPNSGQLVCNAHYDATGAGEAVITASYAGESSHSSGTGSFVLFVVNPNTALAKSAGVVVAGGALIGLGIGAVVLRRKGPGSLEDQAAAVR